MQGRIILDRDQATLLAAIGHAASTDKAREMLTGTLIAWRTGEDGKVTVKATATDSFCAAIREVDGHLAEGTPPRGEVLVNARDLIAAVKTVDRWAKACLDLDGDNLIVGGRILPRLDGRDMPPIQAKIETTVSADKPWQPKRYGALPAFSTTIFAKVAKAHSEPDFPLQMFCLPDEKGETWLKPIMFAPPSKTQRFRAWQMPVRT